MNDKDIEQLIRNEFDAAVPDNFDAILKKLGEAPSAEDKTPMPVSEITNINGGNSGRKQGGWKSGLRAAILAIVILSGVFGYRMVKLPADVVQLDVNPSIELTLNSFGRVLECRALNTDADPITDSFDLDGKTLPYAAKELTKALVKAGYITDEKNSVLVSIIGGSKKHADSLAEDAADAISEAARDADIRAAVLTQSLGVDARSDSAAHRLGISAGKTALVKSFRTCLLEYDEKTLAALTINDLCILAKEYQNSNVGFAGTGKPSTVAYINTEAAELAAKADWLSMGIGAKNISARLTAEHGKLLYIVRAEHGTELLIASVDAATGSILNNFVDKSRYAVSPRPDATVQQGNTSQNEQGGNPTHTEGSSNTTPPLPSQTDVPAPPISSEDALNVALQANGLSADNVSNVRIDEEKHKGYSVYEVRFEQGKLDYKTTVDAATGEIISMFVY